MLEIKNMFADPSNYSVDSKKVNKYIVIHYTANNGDTAKGNCNYFASANRNVSAHFFVDTKEIYRSVLEKNRAWHCRADTYKHKECRNSNSIGIEMCSLKDSAGRYYIDSKTVDLTVSLVKELMATYNIPAENVIRHHDVTGKLCPEPMVRDEKQWLKFKEAIATKEVVLEEEEEVVYYKKISDMPTWAQSEMQELVDQGIIADANNCNLSMDMIRVLIFNKRMIADAIKK